MRHAMQLAKRAQAEGEVPVGAVVVHQGRAIGQGWNQSITQHNACAHAEIMALQEAGKAISNYRLVDATLYVTLEPCTMCAGAMVHARVARLVYGANDSKTGAAGSVYNVVQDLRLNHQLEIQANVEAVACKEQLQAFFKQRRSEIKALKLAKRQAELLASSNETS
ncbi:tRNA adenosine(34) deaminase TadA [Alginatibacterium sediminis]|uniref:tRNA-specific adenosine deaminase n=2 Tax=Alginatibacterium sediminis TaxID=2164068 RepID=A0A420EA32_9ALTE|nr:tRNA adenosine(34) deaminase TadA [Alginatibacterium sediminis]